MKYVFMLLAVWFVYGAINIGFAEWNDAIRRKRILKKDPRQINHPLWAAFYCLVCTPMYLFFKDWYLVGSVLLLHLSVFPVAYNRYADQPAFNLSKTSTAITDRLMVRAGLKSTEIVNIAAFFFSTSLLVISFFI